MKGSRDALLNTYIYVAHEKNMPKIFKCGEGSNPNPSEELMGREDYRETIILFSLYEYLLTAYIYKYLVLAYNK